jgi:pSer/pThr/pTyr-binding forkhead associated (FHA) protein
MADLPPQRPERGSGPAPSLALRFISGKYQGGEFPIKDGQEILVGRSSDLDMVLVEEMVSRRHSRIFMRGGVMGIEDLGSTNGTFVNGEKIQRASIKEGDRVLIGTSILKVVRAGADVPASGRANLQVVATRQQTMRQKSPSGSDEATRMKGSLEEIPLPDLLQLFGTSRKSGVLVVRSDARVGRIYLGEGKLQHSEVEGSPKLEPIKAIFRMLAWRKGIFELEPPHGSTFEHPLHANVQEVLMEAFRQQDEVERIKEQLPAVDTRLTLKTPLEAPLHELEPAHLDTLQLALNCPSVEALFERSRMSELETAEILLSLLHRGYLDSRPKS